MTPTSVTPLSIGAIKIYQGDRAHQNLKYSVMLDAVPRRERPEISAAVRSFVVESGLQADKPTREALGIIVANLFAAWSTRGNPFLTIPMRTTDYTPGSRLRSLWLKFRPTTTAVHALHRAGYIELHKGFYDESKGYRTRIRASDQLVALFIRHRFNLDSIETLDKDTVILRGPKFNGNQGKRIDISRGAHAATARPIKENVRRINEALCAANIELHLAEQDYIEHYVKRPNGKQALLPPHPLRNQLCRVFNVTFAHGGRFYRHWAQGLPRELRRYIRINGNPVMELDFKALHPSLLYAERGLKIEGEVYVPHGWPREYRPVFKLLMLAAINADNLGNAIKGARHDIRCAPDMVASFPECLPDRWLIPAFESLAELHEPIAGAFFTGAGLRLQRKDSDIAERVMLTLLDLDIVAVPIHDSFLVAHPHTEALREAMLAASEDVCGVAIPVDAKWPFPCGQLDEITAEYEMAAPVMDREGLLLGSDSAGSVLRLDSYCASNSPLRHPQEGAVA